MAEYIQQSLNDSQQATQKYNNFLFLDSLTSENIQQLHQGQASNPQEDSTAPFAAAESVHYEEPAVNPERISTLASVLYEEDAPDVREAGNVALTQPVET